MCFSLQRRAIFAHPDFKKWIEPSVFCSKSVTRYELDCMTVMLFLGGHFGSRLGLATKESTCFLLGSCDFMWPGPAVSTLGGVRAHYGLEDRVWLAFAQTAGDCGDDPVTDATFPDAQRLTVMQASHLGMVYRAVRRLVHLQAGGTVANWEDIDPWQEEATSPTRSPTTGGSTGTSERKLKFGQILDQQDDGEFLCDPEGFQGKMLWEMHPSHGWTPPGCRGSDIGTVVGTIKESEGAQVGTLCGLWSLGALPKEDLEGQQVHHLRDDGERHLCIEVGTRAFMLQPLGSLLQSDENCLHHEEKAGGGERNTRLIQRLGMDGGQRETRYDQGVKGKEGSPTKSGVRGRYEEPCQSGGKPANGSVPWPANTPEVEGLRFGISGSPKDSRILRHCKVQGRSEGCRGLGWSFEGNLRAPRNQEEGKGSDGVPHTHGHWTSVGMGGSIRRPGDGGPQVVGGGGPPRHWSPHITRCGIFPPAEETKGGGDPQGAITQELPVCGVQQRGCRGRAGQVWEIGLSTKVA